MQRPQLHKGKFQNRETKKNAVKIEFFRELQEMMAHHVMQMDAHDIADAFHDPMMMAIGSMVVMAGAYMAIVMQEQAAASAFALAAASGKK